MKIAYFNGYSVGSTAYIVDCLYDSLTKMGHEVLCFSSQNIKRIDKADYRYLTPNAALKYFNKIMCHIDGSDGFTNRCQTKRAIRSLLDFKPDIIHLHNMHGEWIDLRLLLECAAKEGIPVIWTLHDSWVATGRCAYFTFNRCERYETGCGSCPHKHEFPKTFILDRSAHFHKLKRRLINQSNISFLTPSKWLADLIAPEFPGKTFEAVGNPYDPDTFHPPIDKRVFNRQHPVVGFSSFFWSLSKGLPYMLQAADILGKRGYRIRVLGNMPKNFTAPEGTEFLGLTTDKKELADFYGSLDCFANPTQQDVYPTVNLESIACGTPVVAFDIAGAAEIIEPGVNGFKVPSGDLDSFVLAIERACLTLNGDKRQSVAKSVSRLQKDSFSMKMLNIYQRTLSAHGKI